ncbi:hypothetical protein [Nocardia bhagyanarayanae]|uniref:Uncharacterized protein n=1 Tax=Nocardia bhagyanarayanae TaxID=1215925 RepID=A0A543FBW1_9NOCA|nr:hypothetical protein [Nocardia bhagyanarayanae]TQM31300.1 hypothetical protein FB390_2955 [Nocardia bhagyanarayanae]
MSRIAALNTRYERTTRLMSTGVGIVAVGDPISARVDAAVRHVYVLVRDNIPGIWDDLLGAAKALRWRLMTQPQPRQFNAALLQAVTAVIDESVRLRQVAGPVVQQAIDELATAAEEAATADPAAGGVLLESLKDAGSDGCVVIAASGSAMVGLANWLAPQGFTVRLASQVVRDQLFVGQGYAIGPPRFFPSSLVTSPTTEALSYIMPGWFGDQAIPNSLLAEYAESAVLVKGRLSAVGETWEAATASRESAEDEGELLPQATWIIPEAPAREPDADEIAARQVLLSGGYAIWLDDGEWIRAVDPSQRGGGRVTTVDVPDVRPGTYLLLRDGQTERRALYDAALELLGSPAQAVEASQARWKATLQARLNQLGRTAVARELAELGIRSSERVYAWTDPMLARPQNNQDFELLLQWLCLPVHPTFELATALRRIRAQASAKIAEQLEDAVGTADMSVLERDGHLRLELEVNGFRGVIATKVLAIAPHVEIVARHDVRILMKNRGSKWLE